MTEPSPSSAAHQDGAKAIRVLEPSVAVVVNGNAKSVTGEVISMLDQILRGTDLFVSHSLEEAKEIAERVVAKRFGTVLTGGGDGTFTVMVTEIVRAADAVGAARPRFGYLKLGTGNALAHVVGATGARVLSADILRLKQEAGSREIGLVEVEGVLTPFCGFGADAVALKDYQAVKTSLSRSWLRGVSAGPLAYAISAATRTLPSYLLRSMPHCRVINMGPEAQRVGRSGKAIGVPIPTGDLIYEGPAQLAGVSTIPYYGYGLRMFPFAEERPERMHLRISTISAAQVVRHAGAIWRGDYDDPSTIFDYLVRDIRVELDPPTAFQIGGDVRGERSHARIALIDKPVRIVDFYSPPSGSTGQV